VSGQQIDSLTVGVGLTQEDFEAGVQKILRSLGTLRTQTEVTGESMTSSLSATSSAVMSLGLKFAGLFIAVKGIEDIVGYFKNLSTELANLGFAGRYLGQSSVELSRFGEVAKLAGGNTQDAITAVQSLQSAIFGLEFQGQISQNLLQLQRLGVGYLTTAGQMRPLKDIATETASALQRQLPGEGNRAMRVQWAAQIFGPGGLSNAIGGGVAELRKFYSESAHDQKSITQRTIDAQMHLQQSLTSLSYEVKSEAAAILSRLTPAIQDLINAIRNDLIPVIDEVIEVILHPLDAIASSPTAQNIVGGTVDTFKNFGRMLEEPFMRGRIEAGKIPESVISRIPSDIASDPHALDVLKIFHFEAGGDAEDPNWSKAITNYVGFYGDDATRAAADYKRAVGEGRPGTIARTHAHALSTPSAARPVHAGATSKPTASTGGPRVQIGSIGPIYTQAKDANGLMASINRAAERKLLVAQSDPGLA
jgi:hypothetical protein